jgi:hypothetical protein
MAGGSGGWGVREEKEGRALGLERVITKEGQGGRGIQRHVFERWGQLTG